MKRPLWKRLFPKTNLFGNACFWWCTLVHHQKTPLKDDGFLSLVGSINAFKEGLYLEDFPPSLRTPRLVRIHQLLVKWLSGESSAGWAPDWKAWPPPALPFIEAGAQRCLHLGEQRFLGPMEEKEMTILCLFFSSFNLVEHLMWNLCTMTGTTTEAFMSGQKLMSWPACCSSSASFHWHPLHNSLYSPLQLLLPFSWSYS